MNHVQPNLPTAGAASNTGSTETAQLYMLQPHDLASSYALITDDAAQIKVGLQALHEALQQHPAHGVARIDDALQQLGQIEMTLMPTTYVTGTTLKSEHADVVDGLMNIKHVQSPEPAKVVAATLLNAAQACLKLLHTFPAFDTVEATRLRNGFAAFAQLYARICGVQTTTAATHAAAFAPTAVAFTNGPTLPDPATAQVDYLWVWQQGHWVFLTLIQGLTLAFRRLRAAADRDDQAAMRQELATATALMWASGAAMKLAGNFDKQIYQEDIRATMVIGDPKSMVEIEVSGIMFWDHHYLVNVIWKQEVAVLLRNLPDELADLHREFVHAYKDGLSAGHIGVCARFGGRETTSLLSSNAMAVEFLEKIEISRLRQIDPMQRVQVMAAESLVIGGQW
jgi:hypothetical protein